MVCLLFKMIIICYSSMNYIIISKMNAIAIFEKNDLHVFFMVFEDKGKIFEWGINPSCITPYLCDLRQASYPLWALQIENQGCSKSYKCLISWFLTLDNKNTELLCYFTLLRVKKCCSQYRINSVSLKQRIILPFLKILQ